RFMTQAIAIHAEISSGLEALWQGLESHRLGTHGAPDGAGEIRHHPAAGSEDTLAARADIGDAAPKILVVPAVLNRQQDPIVLGQRLRTLLQQSAGVSPDRLEAQTQTLGAASEFHRQVHIIVERRRRRGADHEDKWAVAADHIAVILQLAAHLPPAWSDRH